MPIKYILLIFLAGLLAGCNLAPPQVEPTSVLTATPTLEFIQPAATTPPVNIYPAPTVTPQSLESVVLGKAAEVISILKHKDMSALAAYVDPQMGLRFSPYAVVKDTDLVFPAGSVAGLLTDSTIFNWGAYYATGEPIQLTFADYYARFVYDVDFADAPQISLNQRLGVSTTLDNSQEFYPAGMIVEYYIPSIDPQVEGMDWRSLRLVFIQDTDTWYLVGIIHDQWTT